MVYRYCIVPGCGSTTISTLGKTFIKLPIEEKLRKRTQSTSIDAPKIVPMFPAYYIFNGLLILLLVLHCIWTYLILKIVHNSLNAGQMDGDIRSSSDEFSEDIQNHNEQSTVTN